MLYDAICILFLIGAEHSQSSVSFCDSELSRSLVVVL